MRTIDQVNEYIVTPHLIKEDRIRYSHYPSESSVISRTDGMVIGKCHRATAYSWLEYVSTNKVDARGEWTFAFGNKLEAMYIEYFKQLGIWKADHVKFHDRLHNISGEVDAFIFGEKEKTIGIEIKTAYGYGFQKKIKNFPKLENLLQVGIYLDYYPVPEFHLIYHSRDTMENVEYRITMGKDDKGKFLLVDDIPVRVFYIEDIYERYRQLGEFIIKKELPPRDFTYAYSWEDTVKRFDEMKISKTQFAKVKSKKGTDSDWQCLYCRHLEECWAEKRKEILNA